MSKLPTAKDMLDKHATDRGSITIGNFTCVSVSYEKALKAIESHTTAHTKGLREQLESETESRKHWQSQAQRYHKYHKELNAALERVKELENELKLSEDTIKHQAERCLKLEAENSIIHECLTELYNWHDNKVGDIVRGYLDRIDDLAGRS